MKQVRGRFVQLPCRALCSELYASDIWQLLSSLSGGLAPRLPCSPLKPLQRPGRRNPRHFSCTAIPRTVLYSSCVAHRCRRSCSRSCSTFQQPGWRATCGSPPDLPKSATTTTICLCLGYVCDGLAPVAWGLTAAGICPRFGGSPRMCICDPHGHRGCFSFRVRSRCVVLGRWVYAAG